MRDRRTSKRKVVNADVEMHEIFSLVVVDKKNVP